MKVKFISFMVDVVHKRITKNNFDEKILHF